MGRLIAAALVALSLCGCGSNVILQEDSDVVLPSMDQRFVTDDMNEEFSTVVDSRTGVTYLVWTRGTGNYRVGGITVLVNPDGTPVIAEEVTR